MFPLDIAFIGTGEVLVIFVLALIVLGPAALPEMARKIARLMRDAQEASARIRWEIDNLTEHEREPGQSEKPRIEDSQQENHTPSLENDAETSEKNNMEKFWIGDRE